MYQMLRVFCATSWELEEERMAFYDVVGDVNEKETMQFGLLYVPVSLGATSDKRPMQYTVNENIRAVRHYILAIDEDWGPKERDFERDYRLAVQCIADPDLPMSQTRILLRTRPDGTPLPFGATLEAAGFSKIDYTTVDDFKRIVRGLLCEWLPGDVAPKSSAAQG
jgi:hypothetical protein